MTHNGQIEWKKEVEGTNLCHVHWNKRAHRLCTMVQNALLFSCTMSLSLEIRGPGFSLDSAIHSCVTLGKLFHFRDFPLCLSSSLQCEQTV